jgi:hypothetical protein
MRKIASIYGPIRTEVDVWEPNGVCGGAESGSIENKYRVMCLKNRFEPCIAANYVPILTAIDNSEPSNG